MLRSAHVSYVRHGTAILSDVTVSVPGRCLTCLVGPNGAGKTTLLRILSGDLQATSGRLVLGGSDAAALPRKELVRHVSIVPQDTQPPPHITVWELVQLGRFRRRRFFWQRRGQLDRETAKGALARCHLEALSDRQVEDLSRGEQQRAWLAFGLVQDRSFLLLDETLDGLDASAEAHGFRLLKEAAAAGRGVLLTTHSLDLVSRFADRVIVLDGGRVVYEGHPDQNPGIASSIPSQETSRILLTIHRN